MSPTPLETPQVQPLPRAHRRFVFVLSAFLFLTLVPLLVFYAIGYRFDFSNGGIQNIMSVGGMYINTDAENVSIYINDAPVEDLRIFQRAAYIQNLESGQHRVHVQGPGVQTWVKELPVFAHFVTEAAAFNMPVVPQVRLVTAFQTLDGAAVVESTSTAPLVTGSSTQRFFVATSTTATSTFVANLEYTYLSRRFASTTEERSLLQGIQEFAAEPFSFSERMPVAPTTTATTTVRLGDMELRERDGEVYAHWNGEERSIPYYFCVNPIASSSAAVYGAHITAQLYAGASSSVEATSAPIFSAPNRLCRSEIRIDRKWQNVLWFNFLPQSRDHVLMHLEDGLYVVEIDDRAWQNTQPLYRGRNLTVLLDGNRIFLFDGTNYFEVFTELQDV